MFQNEKHLSNDYIASNQKLLKKAAEELRLSEERHKEPRDLILECVKELEDRGFLNFLELTADHHLMKIKEQKDKLKQFIVNELKESTARGLTFDSIYKRVSNQFNNFYTKEFLFKSIDELF